MRIAAASLNQIPLDWEGNIARIEQAISEAKAVHADFLCLPELCLTGYGCEDLFLSDWLAQKALKLLITRILPLTAGLEVAIGLPINSDQLEQAEHGKVYNTMAILKDARDISFRAKQFMAIDGVHYEFRWFTPWPRHQVTRLCYQDEQFTFGDILPSGLGFEICEDAWRKEHRPGFDLANRGARIIFNPSASHFAMGKTLEREALVLESSSVFDCLYVYVNLLGNEAGRMIYDGEILVAHQGKLIAKDRLLQWKDCQLVYVDYDEKENKVEPGKIHPAESKEQEFVAACSLALFDYMRKSKSKGYVLSLSGGADSATCAILVAEMVKRGVSNLGWSIFLKKIGREDLLNLEDKSWKALMPYLLTTAYQATANSGNATFAAANTLAKSIGASFHHWSIQEEFNTMTQKIASVEQRALNWELDDIALQNIQARLRSPMIWMLANMQSKLLLTTSNRSEGDVGYSTMDGDSSGSLAPISGVDKVFVRQFLRWAETDLDYPALQLINTLAPTAELRPPGAHQSDEEDLMPYSLLVAIERAAIKERKSPVQVYQALIDSTELPPADLKKAVIKFFTLWSRNQWKRERTAPSFHLDDFNIDPKTWCRFPILSSGFEQEIKELEAW